MPALSPWNIAWRSTKALTASALIAQLPACASALPVGFDEEAPDGRIHAIVDAARTGDQSRIPDLIAQLDSDDPAVRLFAIRALERLTNQTLGYHHADSIFVRDQAIDRWVHWLEDRDNPTESPVAQGPTP